MSELRINSEYEALIPRPGREEYEALKQSVADNGQYEKIVVNPNLVILDGHSRYKICLELGVTPKYEVRDFGDPLLEKQYVIRSNLDRRHLTVTQKIEMSLPLLEIEKQLAEKRQLSGGFDNLRLNLAEGCQPQLKGRAVEAVADKIGVSRSTYEKALAVIREAPEEMKDKLRKGEISIDYAYQSLKRAEKHRTPPPLPEGIYDVVYADPPWKYYYSALDGSAETQYSTMSLEDICNLQVPSAEDAILFLWATNPLLREALKVMGSWSFEYLTNIVWVKSGLGIGHYVRGDHELLLIGKRGDIPTPEEQNRPSSVLRAEKTGHSRKPSEVYDLIEKMYPNRKYLELFARSPVKRDKWVYWGDQVEGKEVE